MRGKPLENERKLVGTSFHFDSNIKEAIEWLEDSDEKLWTMFSVGQITLTDLKMGLILNREKAFKDVNKNE